MQFSVLMEFSAPFLMWLCFTLCLFMLLFSIFFFFYFYSAGKMISQAMGDEFSMVKIITYRNTHTRRLHLATFVHRFWEVRFKNNSRFLFHFTSIWNLFGQVISNLTIVRLVCFFFSLFPSKCVSSSKRNLSRFVHFRFLLITNCDTDKKKRFLMKHTFYIHLICYTGHIFKHVCTFVRACWFFELC